MADFGLTRDIYETDYYRLNHSARMPIKWMAPESMSDRISDEKTDVVSVSSLSFTSSATGQIKNH